jgi:hypothetical protein
MGVVLLPSLFGKMQRDKIFLHLLSLSFCNAKGMAGMKDVFFLPENWNDKQKFNMLLQKIRQEFTSYSTSNVRVF